MPFPFDEEVARAQVVIDFPHDAARRVPGLRVEIVRQGKPNAEMSGVDVSRRAVRIVHVSPAGMETIAQLTAENAADIADALDAAAATVRHEQSQ